MLGANYDITNNQMTAITCPNCGKPGFTWSIDEEVTQRTEWHCGICGYAAEEYEDRKAVCPSCSEGSYMLLKAEHKLLNYCWKCGEKEVLTPSA